MKCFQWYFNIFFSGTGLSGRPQKAIWRDTNHQDGNPPAIGWRPEPLYGETPSEPLYGATLPAIEAGPNYDCVPNDTTLPPVYPADAYRQHPYPLQYPVSNENNPRRETFPDDPGSSLSGLYEANVPRSKSMPSSPAKQDLQCCDRSPVWRESSPRPLPPSYDANTPLLHQSSPALNRISSTPDSKKTRKHRGNKYVQVDGDKKRKKNSSRDSRLNTDTEDMSGDEVEKETVLWQGTTGVRNATRQS